MPFQTFHLNSVTPVFYRVGIYVKKIIYFHAKRYATLFEFYIYILEDLPVESKFVSPLLLFVM